MVTCNSKMVTFLMGDNTIVLQDSLEAVKFANALGKIGLNAADAINKAKGQYPIMLNYVNSIGFLLWSPEEQVMSENYFGIEPYEWLDIEKECL